MNAVTPLVEAPRRLRLVEKLVPPHADVPASVEETTVEEEQRWLWLLVPPFVVGAAFFAAAVGTGSAWWMVPGFLLGPLLIIGAFIYLGLSSDSS